MILDEKALDAAMKVAPLPTDEGAAAHRRQFLTDAITAYFEEAPPIVPAAIAEGRRRVMGWRSGSH